MEKSIIKFNYKKTKWTLTMEKIKNHPPSQILNMIIMTISE